MPVSWVRLFPVLRNDLIEETPAEVLAGAIERLRRLLPRGWDVTLSYDELGVAAPAAGRVDAILAVRAPDGNTASLLVEVKVGRMRDAGRAVERIRKLADDLGRPAILVAPYIGPGLRQQCTANGVSYLDLTGWCRLEVSSPPMVIQSVGAGQDPRPPRSSIILRLNGVGAGRVVRSLLDDELPAGVRDVARRATVSPGTVSKVLKALEAEAIVTRDESGRIEAVRKRHLVDRWIRDYSFLKTNAVRWYLAPRSLEGVVEELAADAGWVVATGSLAAREALPGRAVPVVPLAQLALYVPGVSEAARRLELVPTERPTANVLLARPYDTQLLTGQTGQPGRIPTVGQGQTVADLKTMPGRAPQEADQVMDHLATADHGWRDE
jgi:DNA-binding transcriptional ArsR family regulator